MFGKIFLIILIIGFCDAYLVIWSAQALTWIGAIGICLLTAFIGSYLFKREGLRVLIEFQNELRGGNLALDKLADGVLVLIGGALLVTPGYITDLIGFLLMIPLFRKLVKPILLSYAKKNMHVSFHATGFSGSSHFQHNSNNSSNEKEAEIIDIK